jgi:hypothetical protein
MVELAVAFRIITLLIDPTIYLHFGSGDIKEVTAEFKRFWVILYENRE